MLALVVVVVATGATVVEAVLPGIVGMTLDNKIKLFGFGFSRLTMFRLQVQ